MDFDIERDSVRLQVSSEFRLDYLFSLAHTASVGLETSVLEEEVT
jgi:hypothetical protein